MRPDRLKQIPKEAREDYMRRLDAPRANGGQSFRDMYDNGPGHELAMWEIRGRPHIRFMSPRSPARLAFDVFSALDGKADKLELEKPLPGLHKHWPPYVDAYYEAGNQIVFIKSVYNELCCYIAIRRMAELDRHSTELAYHPERGPWPPILNLNEDAETARLYREFSIEVNKEYQRFLKQPDGFHWFDAEQQTVRIFSIIGWALRWGMSPRDLRGKTLHLITSVWRMADDRVSVEEEGTFPHFFKRKAEIFVNEMFWHKKLSCRFAYDAAPTRELVLPGIGRAMDLQPFATDLSMERLLAQYELSEGKKRT